MLTFLRSGYRCNQIRQKWKQSDDENDTQGDVCFRWVEAGWTRGLHINYIKNSASIWMVGLRMLTTYIKGGHAVTKKREDVMTMEYMTTQFCASHSKEEQEINLMVPVGVEWRSHSKLRAMWAAEDGSSRFSVVIWPDSLLFSICDVPAMWMHIFIYIISFNSCY